MFQASLYAAEETTREIEYFELLNDLQLDKGIRVATDIGGTFTDLVYVDGGQIHCIKSHTTPDKFEQGVINALVKSGLGADQVTFFAHGSTIVINALTERKGVKTGLLTTRGFRDVLEIARGNTPDLFNSYYRKPKPFIPRYLRKEVSERVDFRGAVLEPLAEDELTAALQFFRENGVEALAVCFLHSYINPENERLALEIISRQLPEITVVASHQVSREWREYERTNTTAMSAYVLPPVRSYLDKLERQLQSNGLNCEPSIVQSNGGIATISTARTNPISLVESGPASGVLGALTYAELIQTGNLLTLDIGGTTAKCSLIQDGTVRITTDYYIEKTPKSAGYPIKTPVVDIVEVGNGGGSIAWIDNAGSLHVGPRSAGSFPGPVAYGSGGMEPTTTDANLLIGRINPELFSGGEMKPDLESVRTAFAGLANRLNAEPMEVARGVIRIANANMVNGLKLVSLNRGLDPRDFSLMAFGGGGGLHAVDLAAELNIPRVIIPPHPAIFSAWGMLAIDLRRDYINTAIIRLTPDTWGTVKDKFGELQQQAEARFVADGIEHGNIYHRRYLDIRYVGQEHTVKVKLGGSLSSTADLIEIFHQAHEKEYTFRLDNPLEVVNFHLVSFGKIDKAGLQPLPRPQNATATNAHTGTRLVDYGALGIHKATLYQRDLLSPGARIQGPAVIEETSTGIVINPGNHVRVDEYGGLHIYINGG